MKKEFSLLSIMLATGMAIGTPAHAGDLNRHNAGIDIYESIGSRSVSVPISDLDLNSSADRASLKRRIDHAVWNVCDRDGQPSGLKKTAYIHCVRDAWADALAQVDRAVAVAGNPSGPAGAAGSGMAR